MKNYPNFRKLLALLLVLAMVLPSVSMTVFSQDLPCAEDGCSGKYRSGICSVDGSHYEAAPFEDGVYLISNAGQLYWFAALVNGGGNEYLCDNGDVYDAVLTADITLEDITWTPIGLYTSATEYVRYSGTFDGRGYTIYGLTYDNTAYHGRNAGLFGTVDANGTVRDLTLADSVINGATEIGGIASHNYGTIINCTQSGTVTGTGATGGIVCRNMEGAVVDNCTNTGTVTGATTGGIAAENCGSIVYCANFGPVSGTNSVGGIVGMNSATVEDCLNIAAVTAENTHVGGVVGNHIGGEITGSGNTGNVTGASDYIGGVAGACVGAAITASYNEGDITGAEKSEAVSGVVGAIDGSNTAESSVTSCYNIGKVNGRSWLGGIAGVSGYQKTPKTVTIRNGYSTGAVSGISRTGAVVGSMSKGTASGVYYLSGGQNSVSGATAATAEQFASGEIAAELNAVCNVWYQNLDLPGVQSDASPVLDESHGVVYAGYCNCTDQGYTNRENYDEPGDHVDEDGDMVCDKCGATLGEAHEHEFSDWERTKEPTCSEFGEEVRICSICNYPQKRKVDKLPHTEEIIPGTPATFDEPGTTDGKKCTVCGEITVQQEYAPVLDYNEGIVPLNTLIVSCGDYEPNGGASEGPAELAVDDDLNTIWHTDWQGTSRENHWIQFELTEEYYVDGLRYKPRVTGNTNGIITRYDILVSDDGVNFRSVSTSDWAGDRNWKVVEFDAQIVKYVRLVAVDALTDNSWVFACAAEVRLTGSKDIEVHEHSFGQWSVTTQPTCTATGVETRSCECGKSEEREIPALGHAYESVITVPTCTAEGYTTHTCTVCGDMYIDAYTQALGHEWKGTGCIRCEDKRENPFVDVPEDSFYIDPVLWAVEKGITNGVDATHFNPTGTCQRAAVVTFLWRAAGSPEPTSANNPFTDVKESDFFYKAVLWAVEKGITNGLTADQFGPYALCNRAQVVTFLWRAQGEPKPTTAQNPFSDVNTAEWYGNAVLWAVEKGITNGMSKTQFGVTAICNRAQVVTFLYRSCN